MHTVTTTATATKTSLKKRIRAYSISLNSSNVGKVFWEMNSKGLYQSSGKENESCCLAFMSSTKREFRHFHVVVVQRRQKNVPIDFLPFSLPPPSSLLKLPKDLAYPVREFARRGPKFRPATRKEAALILACENIRFSSLLAVGDETSPAAKSEEKRMFSQATLIRNLTAFEHFLILSDFGSDVYRIFRATFPRRYM